MSKEKVQWLILPAVRTVELSDEAEKALEEAYGSTRQPVLVQDMGEMQPDSPWVAQGIRQEKFEEQTAATAAKFGGGDAGKAIAHAWNVMGPLFGKKS